MKLGKNERELLSYIDRTPGDVFLGFLLSSGSAYRAERISNQLAIERHAKQEEVRLERQKLKRRLRQLEQKRLIKLVVTGTGQQKIVLEKRSDDYLKEERLIKELINAKKVSWDGQWTLVMFDIPQQGKDKRYRLGAILKRIGFLQVQQSNYVFPYKVSELEDFLKENKHYGEYCHVFRGSYSGDDANLQKKFSL